MEKLKPESRIATVWYRDRFLNITEYTLLRIRERNVRCDCGGPEMGTGHAPDCSWILAGDDAAQDFADLWAEQGETGGRMVP